MIDTGPIRAAARATAGDLVALSKAQLDQLLDDVEAGQRARRALRRIQAVPSAGIGGVSDPD